MSCGEDITEAGSIRPRRLLTVTNQDEYALYENIGFTRLILQTVAFLRHHIRAVREFLYADDILSRNLLERGSHLYYVLAVGKLRTGYMRGHGGVPRYGTAVPCADGIPV